jgi:hypothetical protein
MARTYRLRLSVANLAQAVCRGGTPDVCGANQTRAEMKRIYLDQLHWIALARLATGKDINAKRAEALTLILYAV